MDEYGSTGLARKGGERGRGEGVKVGVNLRPRPGNQGEKDWRGENWAFGTEITRGI